MAGPSSPTKSAAEQALSTETAESNAILQPGTERPSILSRFSGYMGGRVNLSGIALTIHRQRSRLESKDPMQTGIFFEVFDIPMSFPVASGAQSNICVLVSSVSGGCLDTHNSTVDHITQ